MSEPESDRMIEAEPGEAGSRQEVPGRQRTGRGQRAAGSDRRDPAAPPVADPGCRGPRPRAGGLCAGRRPAPGLWLAGRGQVHLRPPDQPGRVGDVVADHLRDGRRDRHRPAAGHHAALAEPGAEERCLAVHLDLPGDPGLRAAGVLGHRGADLPGVHAGHSVHGRRGSPSRTRSSPTSSSPP